VQADPEEQEAAAAHGPQVHGDHPHALPAAQTAPNKGVRPREQTAHAAVSEAGHAAREALLPTDGGPLVGALEAHPAALSGRAGRLGPGQSGGGGKGRLGGRARGLQAVEAEGRGHGLRHGRGVGPERRRLPAGEQGRHREVRLLAHGLLRPHLCRGLPRGPPLRHPHEDSAHQ